MVRKNQNTGQPWTGREHPDNQMKQNHSLYCRIRIKEWIALRREHLALRRGNYRTIYCNDVTGVYAFSRCYEEDRVLVVLNTGPDKVELTSAEIQELQEKNIELSSYEGRLVAF